MDPYRTSGDNAFDFQRHFGELIRWVLPIFVLVTVAGFLAYLWLAPPPQESAVGGVDAPPARVGLLPVEQSDSETDSDALAFDPAFVTLRPLELAKAPVSPRFDAPMGSPLGALTYNAQPFLTTRHLGDDLNGIGGWDSDLGDAVHAAGDGEVVYAGWPSDGWGNVVMILHRPTGKPEVITFYGHLDTVTVPVGAVVRRGDRIGTVGKADGRYLAHLHFEVRPAASLSPGPGYGDSALGRFAGEPFIARYRGAPTDQQNAALGGAFSSGPNAATKSDSPSLQIETQTESEGENREFSDSKR